MEPADGSGKLQLPPPLPHSGSGSSRFNFQLDFSRDNPGVLETCYELERHSIGEGTFGCARRARCMHTGNLRAVKSIKTKAVKDPKRLQVEISIARKLDHPNVVRLFEIFQDAEHIHLVMELCSGGELFDRIVGEGVNGFGEETSAKYVQQMLAAVCYMHAHSIAHRDIKPENYLFQTRDQNAKLKIIDFGLAKEFQPDQPMSTRVGTPYYVAPEVLRGSYNAKCDVWSVGVITYLLLCGYAPFSGDNDSEILKKVKKGSYKFEGTAWSSVSQGAIHAVQKLLAFEPQKRSSAEQAMEIPWVKGSGSTIRKPAGANVTNVVDRLQSFREHSRMKRVALTAVARQLPDGESNKLGDIFRAIDRNGDGELSVEEVRRGLAAHSIQPPQALEEILLSVDCNGSGTIDYTEFMAAMVDQELYTKRDLCWAAFCTFDLDGDGRITTDELCKVLSKDIFESSASRDQIAKMVMEVDRDGDGTIDFDEFCTMMSPKGHRLPRSTAPPSIQKASWSAVRGSSTAGACAEGRAKESRWSAAGTRVRAAFALMATSRFRRRSQEREQAKGKTSKWPCCSRGSSVPRSS